MLIIEQILIRTATMFGQIEQCNSGYVHTYVLYISPIKHEVDDQIYLIGINQLQSFESKMTLGTSPNICHCYNQNGLLFVESFYFARKNRKALR